MNTIFILFFICIILIFFIIFYYIQSKTYNSIPVSEQITQKHSPKLIKNSTINCEKGCPINNTNEDNKLFNLYTSYHGFRGNNKTLNKKKNFSPIGPANIFIIRHGEKTNSLVSLDCNGIYRSTFNLDLLREINKKGFGIDFIVTTNPDILSGAMHIQQTVMALSWLLDIPLFIFGDMNNPEIAVSKIYSNHIFNNKNVLFCWEHTCIQELLLSITKTGPFVKKIPNKAFLDKNGNLSLPYWASNNYQTVIHIDEDFNDFIYSSGIKTCYKQDNSKLIFGKHQTCKTVA